MRTHKDLDVWNKSMDLVEKIYKLTMKFPSDEKFGLISQVRRAAVSVPSNIAEGAARNTTKEFIQFLYVSCGSITELETQLILSQRLGYLEDGGILDEIGKTKALLLGLIRSLRNKLNN